MINENTKVYKQERGSARVQRNWALGLTFVRVSCAGPSPFYAPAQAKLCRECYCR